MEDVWFALHPIAWFEVVFFAILLDHQLPVYDPPHLIVGVGVGRVAGARRIAPGKDVEKALLTEGLFDGFGVGDACAGNLNHFAF